MTPKDFGDRVKNGIGIGLGFGLFGSWMLPLAGLALLFGGKPRPQQQPKQQAKPQPQEPKPARPPVLDPKIARDALHQIEWTNSQVQIQKDRDALERAWKLSSRKKS